MSVPTPPSTPARRRWVLLVVLVGVAASALVWRDTPSERHVTVEIAATASAQRVEVTWLDHRGEPLRQLVRHFDGSGTRRSFNTQVTAPAGPCGLRIRVVNANGTQERRHRLREDQSDGVTVFAP